MATTTRNSLAALLAGCLTFAGGCASTPPTATTAGIDPQALHAVDRMRAAVGQFEQYRMIVKSVTDEALPSGQLVQVGRTTEIRVSRPNQMTITVTRDSGARWSAWFQNGTFTLVDETAKRWAQVALPASIDPALQKLEDDYGLFLPLSDLMSGLRRAELLRNVESGLYVGTEMVGGRECDHVIFRQPVADWQAWIETADPAVPRRILMTYKDEPGQPRYLVTVKEWNPIAPADAGDWRPTVPADSVEVPIAELLRTE